jgi:cyclophilin family peptidyl-prolyl cis-trans isomerase
LLHRQPRSNEYLQLDGNHVVFGEVVDGMNLVKEIEAVGSGSGRPSKKVEITECGVLDQVD